ncbi:MAG TPA: DUF3237 family protein [Bacteroidaceae bacterium]|jgi:hypothetical protein|nr:MAG: hypothetical protein BWY95_01049 [Bacteroidetes bacterium ADurb.BinA104]HPX99714.1 DUF3237 family protein [Bacteroidaceae bacterium]
MKRIFFVAAVMTMLSNVNVNAQFGAGAAQQQNAEPKAPELEYVLRLNVALGQAFTVGDTGKGVRTVIPITGGTFEGPDMKGEVLPGGADYQMRYDDRSEIEAIYCIRTDDGVSIHIRNYGIIKMGGQGGMYFRCAPKFEAPKDSKYAWMNECLFLCQPGFGAGGGITLDVWKVK